MLIIDALNCLISESIGAVPSVALISVIRTLSLVTVSSASVTVSFFSVIEEFASINEALFIVAGVSVFSTEASRELVTSASVSTTVEVTELRAWFKS